jgi:class 3 adenylate cyclase
LPIYDKAHVRSALGRFDQVQFESAAARDLARKRVLQAAKRFGVVPVGFIEAQIRKERGRSAAQRRGERMAALPSGAVTFLMTDIEGSTALLAALGDDYAGVLADVRRLLRSRVRAAGGHEVEAHADEYLAAFSRTVDALAAAIAIQRRMAAKAWPRPHTVRVRIGLHRGHPNKTDTGYIGLSVHATARVCQAAHGGQIVLSRWVFDSLGDDAPEGVSLRNLGEHRLRGFPRPDDLFQVEAEGLALEFPALRTEL